MKLLPGSTVLAGKHVRWLGALDCSSASPANALQSACSCGGLAEGMPRFGKLNFVQDMKRHQWPLRWGCVCSHAMILRCVMAVLHWCGLGLGQGVRMVCGAEACLLFSSVTLYFLDRLLAELLVLVLRNAGHGCAGQQTVGPLGRCTEGMRWNLHRVTSAHKLSRDFLQFSSDLHANGTNSHSEPPIGLNVSQH
ncbi:unnamed protein product [Ostreobium quekettii]|uniref:Uncharacterized protein n=1 Tax=Ostreobium quekettii TaxID=121088 RepID=A0A8S1IKM8_9CHLO|nr:unnamed protein product [Ostreobium quekettii]